MGKAEPRKGKGYEREIVTKLTVLGFSAERARGSDGRAIGELKECDVRFWSAGTKWLLQLFRPGKLGKKFIPPEGIDAVVFRQDRGEDMIMMRFNDFLELLP